MQDNNNSSKKIWIVDDDRPILDAIDIVLKDAGYETRVFDSGIKLKQILEISRPDLILLDILLSGESGVEVCKELKHHDEHRDIPVILMSADMHLDKKYEDAGANNYLKKPFDIDALVELVEQHINP